MFGLYRTVLAIYVMAFHVLGIPSIGPYAVYAFFILSGFLMTTIMHDSYGYSTLGFKKYAINRFLRLYPVYWALLVITCLVIVYIAGQSFSADYHGSIRLPSDSYEFFTNLAMIFPTGGLSVDPRLHPATWAITIELFYYVLIGLGLSRSKNITLVWFAASVVYAFYPLTYGSLDIGYRDIWGASLPFSIGALIYFYKEEIFSLLERVKLTSPLLLTSIFSMNMLVVVMVHYLLPDWWWKIDYVGTLLNLLLSALMLVMLYKRGQEIFSPKVDRFLGDFSYPIYLFHWTAAIFVAYLLYQSPIKGTSVSGLVVFSVALVVTLIVSYLVNVGVNDRIELIRKRVKQRNALNK